MKHTSHPQSATSLPRAPRDDVSSRSARYLIMMAVRIVCLVLMVLIQPLGWYTAVFAAGAIFLPYVAVVLANVSEDTKTVDATSPEHAIEAEAHHTPPAEDPVIRVSENRGVTSGREHPGSSR